MAKWSFPKIFALTIAIGISLAILAVILSPKSSEIKSSEIVVVDTMHKLNPDRYYCAFFRIDVAGNYDYEFKAVNPDSHLIVFIYRIPGRTPECYPPATFMFEYGGEEVESWSGDNTYRGAIYLQKGHYVLIVAQTNQYIGETYGEFRIAR